MRTVAALYIDPRGPYPKLGPSVDCFDEFRDARTFTDTIPVVAHPPCGPWGRLRHLSRRPQDRELAIDAVSVVRANGGVLEHPRGSLLWKELGLPQPGELPDAWGGRTVEVSQCDWGHVARKTTWLYCVGVDRALLAIRPAPREPTHWVSGSRATPGRKRPPSSGDVPPGIKVCSAQQRRRTPPLFAEWLVFLARSVP